METANTGLVEALAFLFFATISFLILGSTGKVHLGFYNPYFLPPLKKHYKRILKQHFPFYQALPPKSQSIFEKRVQFFIHQKYFVFRTKNGEVTDEMKVLISAAAIQLTFGLPKVKLKHFKKIIIYPSSYYSGVTQQKHKGEVNPGLGAIVLSWEAFKLGYKDTSDGINLGLHEMAHALKLENIIRNGEHGFVSPKNLEIWDTLVKDLMPKIRSHANIFRSYAFVNQEEFFAVSTELFFEKPMELREFNKDLYSSLCRILNQDPIYLQNPGSVE